MNPNLNRRRFLICTGLGWMSMAHARPARAFEEAGLSDTARKLLAGVTWIKQAGFRVQEGNQVLYFDPYEVAASPHDADAILISHSHNDHCHTSSVTKLAKENTVAVTEPEAAAKIKSLVQDLRVTAPGETLNVGGWKIETVPSYNINKTNHPRSKNWLGFVVTLRDGRRFYHAGDTDHIPEMADIDCDVALLPCGGTYTMNTAEAAEAARAIQPALVVPMHFGSVVGTPKDGLTLQSLLKGVVETVVFDPGQSVAPPATRIPGWKSQ